MVAKLMLLQLLLLWLTMVDSAPSLVNTSCPDKCGDVTIPYPFGFQSGCFREKFQIICDDTFQPHIPFFSKHEILEIDVSQGEIRLQNWPARSCYKDGKLELGNQIGNVSLNLTKVGTQYTFSDRNLFTAVGCDTIGVVEWNDFSGGGCVSIWLQVRDEPYSGFRYCQTPIPKGTTTYEFSLISIFNHTNTTYPCDYAFLSEEGRFKRSSSNQTDDGFYNQTDDGFYNQTLKSIPIVIDWAITDESCEEGRCGDHASCSISTNELGFLCHCQPGYEGNPYVECQDVNECEQENDCVENACQNTAGSYTCVCSDDFRGDGRKDGSRCFKRSFSILIVILCTFFGLLFLLIVTSWIYWGLKKRKLMKLKEKFFKQNGGLLLQQQMSLTAGISETTRIFTSEELKKATNNYDESRILGKGGYGTVYKGILPDKRVVAIKKSKVVEKDQIVQFINEVAILTQTNHRNVVKLLGCCLETEVPVLVYEYISNGTLFHHVHDQENMSSLSWDNRLRIATETAEALAYLHSSASIPIFHRDVKSTNILLDENYTAKVSDFGASRLVPMDKTQVTTLVQGTLGYLDPEYMHTSQLTDKSDVYSFGVVLVELLTGKLPLSFQRPEAERNLSLYFLSSMKNNHLFEILEPRVVDEGMIEQLVAVAELARRCLKLKGDDRPTMKEVAAELQGLRRFEQHPWVNDNHEEAEHLLGETFLGCNGDSNGYDSMKTQEMLPSKILR